MKNIVIVYPTLPKYRADFFNLLNKKLEIIGRHLVVIAGTNLGPKKVNEIESDHSFTVVRSKRVGFSMLGYQIQWKKGLFSFIKKHNPEKVIFMYNAGILNYSLLMLYLYFKKIPFIIWGSGHRRIGLSSLKFKYKDIFKKYFIKKSSGYITYSMHFANQLEIDGYDKRRIFCAQNTINVEKIINNNSYSKNARAYDMIKFLFVGVLIPAKNLDKAIKICKRLKEENWKFRFDIVGEGIIKNSLIDLVDNLDLKNNVFIHGAKYDDEVSYFFRAANVFILPGIGGLAINEAMAYALPIITTPSDGTAYDLIVNGVNGFLLDFDYITDELYEKMKYFLNIDKDQLEVMGQKSLQIIRGKATLNNMADRFIDSILNNS